MKQTILFIIACYQRFVSPLVKQLLGVPSMCRYSPSCSEYTKRMIQKHGVIAGGRLGLERMVACR